MSTTPRSWVSSCDAMNRNPQMKTTNGEKLPNRQKSAGRKLKDLSAGFAQALQFLGYIPATFDENCRLSPWNIYLSFFYSALNVGICLFMTISYTRVEKYTPDLSMSPTEIFVRQLVFVSGTINKVFFTMKGFCQRNSIAQFWNYHVDMAEAIFKMTDDFQNYSNDQNSNILDKMRKHLRRFYATILGLTCLATASNIAIILIFFSEESTGLLSYAYKLIMLALSGWYMIHTYLHVFNSLYSAFYLNLYTGCVHMINQELRQVTVLSQSLKTTFLARKQVDVGGIVGVDERIRACVRTYQLIAKLVREYNAHFGGGIILEFLCSMMSITSCTFFMFVWMDKPFSITIMMPAVLAAVQIYVQSSQASLLQAEAAGVVRNLSALALDDMITSSLLSQLQLLSTAIGNNCLEIQPGNFFTLDRQMLTTVCSALVTYLIIMIQFQLM